MACLPAKRKASTVRPGGLRGLPACKAQSEHGASGWLTMACLRSKGRQRVRVGDKETSRTPGRQSHTTNGEEQTRKLKMGGNSRTRPQQSIRLAALQKHNSVLQSDARALEPGQGHFLHCRSHCTTARRVRPRTRSRSFSLLWKAQFCTTERRIRPRTASRSFVLTTEVTILYYRATSAPSTLEPGQGHFLHYRVTILYCAATSPPSNRVKVIFFTAEVTILHYRAVGN